MADLKELIALMESLADGIEREVAGLRAGAERLAEAVAEADVPEHSRAVLATATRRLVVNLAPDVAVPSFLGDVLRALEHAGQPADAEALARLRGRVMPH